MNLRVLLTAAIVAAATTFTTPASAAAPGDTDLLCGLLATADPNPEAPENTMTGTLHGGPIAQNGTITCTVRVGANGYHSSTGVGAQAEATGTSGTTVLSPTLVSYTAAPLENVYLCDQFADSSGTVYVFDAADGAWEVAFGNATAECRLAVSASTHDAILDPVQDLLAEALGEFCDPEYQCPPYICIPFVGCWLAAASVTVVPQTA